MCSRLLAAPWKHLAGCCCWLISDCRDHHTPATRSLWFWYKRPIPNYFRSASCPGSINHCWEKWDLDPGVLTPSHLAHLSSLVFWSWVGLQVAECLLTFTETWPVSSNSCFPSCSRHHDVSLTLPSCERRWPWRKSLGGGGSFKSLIRNHPAGENKSLGTVGTLNGFGVLGSECCVKKQEETWDECSWACTTVRLQWDMGNWCQGQDEITDQVARASHTAVSSFQKMLLSWCGTLQAQYRWYCGKAMVLVSCFLHGNCGSAVVQTYFHFHAVFPSTLVWWPSENFIDPFWRILSPNWSWKCLTPSLKCWSVIEIGLIELCMLGITFPSVG